MTITVDIAGTSVPVPVSEEQLQLIRRDAEANFAWRIVDALTEKAATALNYELTEDEVAQIRNQYQLSETSSDEFIRSLASGDLYSRIGESVREAVEARAKYYTVRIRATQEFDIVVKATSADEAEDYADRLDYTDLSDYLSDYDHEFETLEVESPGSDTMPQNRSTDYFDATED